MSVGCLHIQLLDAKQVVDWVQGMVMDSFPIFFHYHQLF